MAWKTREEFIADCDEFEAIGMRRAEWRYIDQKLTALMQRQFEGDDSVLTRDRIARLEALQACLSGSPEALGQEPVRRSLRA